MVQLRKRGGRKVTTISSDEEEDSSSPSTTNAVKERKETSISGSPPTKLPSRSKQTQAKLESSQPATGSATPTPQGTPKKQKRGGAKSKSPDQSKTRTLYSFFNKTTERQQYAPKPISENVPQKEEEDEIQDQISDDEDSVILLETHSKTKPYTSTAQKRSFDGLDPHGVISGSQKYLRRPDGTRDSPMPLNAGRDVRTWNEKHAPTELSELVVHKKKVADVREWLERSLNGHRYSKLLVLKGAAGSGKTTTIAMLSRAIQFAIIEWRNPISTESGADRSASVSAQLEDFLGRGSKFGGLELVSVNGGSNNVTATVDSKSQLPSDRHILLMEEFPNNLTRATATLQSFRSTVIQYLEANTQATVPLVMIISESVISESSSSIDNFTAHRVLGPEILHHPAAAVIEFNRVAPTFIGKALNLALRKHNRENVKSYQPSEAALKKLAEFGDVRNAISTLEFLCTQRGTESLVGNRKTKLPGKNKSASSAIANLQIPEEELSIISLRESSIGLFHAVGRVLYNKRLLPQDSAHSQSEEMSSHLSHFRRVQTSEVDLESLIDETGTDTSTFLSGLHENYVLSCFSSDGDSEVTLENIVNCSHSLADADLLHGSHYSNSKVNMISSGLRQSELSFQVGVRGLLFGLPHPVKRQPPPGKSKAAAHQMFYPTSLKLWRSREEIQELTNLFVQRAMNGTMLPWRQPYTIKRFSKTSVSNMTQSQAQNNSQSKEYIKSQASLDPGQQRAEDEGTLQRRVVLGSGNSASHEMLLERLPFMKLIFAKQGDTWNSSLLKQVNQVVQFTGVGIPQDEDGDELDPLLLEANSSPKHPLKNSKSGRNMFSLGSGGRSGSHSDLEGVEKLVLSDDDIEDD